MWFTKRAAFGFGLYRALKALGAHCHVIAPRKLDEQCTRVKTDPRDATTLCQCLSRYLDGNTRELAVIHVPTEEEEQELQKDFRCVWINTNALPIFEIALVLMRSYHIASGIVNADHGIV